MVKNSACVLSICIVLTTACTDVAEHEYLYTVGLNVFSTGDLSHLSNFPVAAHARAILTADDMLFVSGTDGFVHCYSTVTTDLLGENQVGSPSTWGYTDMVFNPLRETIYLAGSTGSILELSIPDCTVIAEFSVCASPIHLEVTSGTPGYLWVVDGTENTISQVHLEDNEYCGSLSYGDQSAITAIEASIYDDSLLVGTAMGFFRLETSGPGNLRSTFVSTSPADCRSLASIPGDSNFVAVIGFNDLSIGELCVYDDSMYLYPPQPFYNSVPLEGTYPLNASGSSGEYVYVLTCIGQGISRLSSYRAGSDYGIEASVDVPGYPLDLKVSHEGRIYALTYE